VAAGYAGVAGAMFVQATGAVPPDVLSFERSSALLLVLLIGGAGYLYGGVIGAIVFTLAQHWLGGLPPQYWQFAIGAVLMLIGLIGHARVARWPALVQAISARLARSRLVGSGAVAPPGGER
jgi:branched-chain amino acid transport system permease protein